MVNKENEKIKVIQEKIQLKESVYENMRTNADQAMKKMKDKHNHKRNKKTYDYQIDDHVSVKIPSIDHGGTELRRLPFVIVDVHHDKYQLACQWGILEDLYGAQHLEIYHGLIEFNSNKQVVFSKEENLPVAIKEDFFSILYALHLLFINYYIFLNVYAQIYKFICINYE